MDNLKSSFDDVADEMERYLECLRSQEVGMTFAAIIRVYGQLSTLPPKPQGLAPTTDERDLIVRSELLLASLSARIRKTNYRTANRTKSVEPVSMRTNMIYDPGPQKRDGDSAV